MGIEEGLGQGITLEVMVIKTDPTPGEEIQDKVTTKDTLEIQKVSMRKVTINPGKEEKVTKIKEVETVPEEIDMKEETLGNVVETDPAAGMEKETRAIVTGMEAKITKEETVPLIKR